ncbi:MAG: hypothetical protein KJP21_07090, partial [Bacteroidia bacterium]|nr:hypothetical protein [Bacteroidia bacterium]
MYRILPIILLLLSFISHAQTELVLDICDAMPSDWYKKDLTKLVVKNGQGYCVSPTKILDKRIAKLSNLQELVYWNDIYQMDSNSNVTLPEEICKLKKLEKLSTNVISDQVFKLKELKQLSLSFGNNTDILHELGLGELTKLEKLSLSFGNHPSDLEVKGLANLPGIQEIELRNPTQAIIDAALQNSNLTAVTISQTEGMSFDFSKCVNLKSINLDFNKLSFVPASIYNLKNLEILSLTYNVISNVDPAIAQLSRLTNFSMYHNTLVSLPE